ncbi:GIY-YIG nuclease family protein [Candidatus Falkowbacteria bacterium]|nr:GIY-YIG nuclease family protein [Candidatus Falkowbacteria bacterium]
MYWVYILESLKDGNYYTGSTAHVNDRLKRHNQGRSAATKNRRPWKLVYTKNFSNKSDAIKFEYSVKRQKSKKFIQDLY